jgi:hypothetical protein
MKFPKTVLIFLSLVLTACGKEHNTSGNFLTPSVDLKANGTAFSIMDLSSSSFLQEKTDLYAYHPWKASDGDPKTAWNEGVEGPGIGESLKIVLENDHRNPVVYDRIEIMPGFYDEKWYKKNNRIKKLQIIDGDFKYEATFVDGMNVKTINLPQPVFSTGILSFIIKDVFGGEAYDETCISEISIFNDAVKYEVSEKYKERMLEMERRYQAVRQEIAKRFTEGYFESPGGKVFLIPGSMGYGINEFYFNNGIYVSEVTEGLGRFSRSFGTWEMDPLTKVIRIHISKTAVVIGLGEHACMTPCSQEYYGDYKYEENEVDQNKKIEWIDYLYYNLCTEQIIGYTRVKNISEADDIMLPQNWKQQAALFIEGAIGEYKSILEAHKKGKY